MAVSLSVANSNTKTLILTNSSSNHYKQSVKASPWPCWRSIMGWKPTVLLLLFKTKTTAQLVVVCRMKNRILAVLLTVSFQEQDHAGLSSWLPFVRFHWGYSLSWFVGNKKMSIVLLSTLRTSTATAWWTVGHTIPFLLFSCHSSD